MLAATERPWDVHGGGCVEGPGRTRRATGTVRVGVQAAPRQEGVAVGGPPGLWH